MSANHRSGRDHTVIDILDDREKSKKCIVRVPNVLWRQNPEAYAPDVVSIGPFHHYPEKRGKEGYGEKYFQLMERAKIAYLNKILTGMKNITLEELTTEVIKLSDEKNEGEFEQRARDFYAEPLDHISSAEFIKMMIVDGCFLIQLFRKCNDLKPLTFDDDPVFNMNCMFHFLCHDILLLENQLPWFVIHILYDLTHDICPNEASLPILIMKALGTLPSLKQSSSSYIEHIYFQRHKHHSDDYLHILDLVRTSIVIPIKNMEKYAVVYPASIVIPIRTVTALSEAGIISEVVVKESLLDIQFEEGVATNGVLRIPQLNIGMLSETLFRNLIAIEQCYHGYLNEITSYVILMDNLISSKEDMELLCKKKVIVHWLSDEEGYKFFKNLCKDIPHNKFYYAAFCKKVNDRYNLRRYHMERRCNFYLPKLLYVFVGIILLQVIPTMLQTTFTIKQYYYPQK